MELNTAESLDPEDWDEFRRIGHQMVDDMLDSMRTARLRPAWRSVPQSVRDALDQPIPYDGASIGDVYQEFCDYVLPYPTGNQHPRFFGWVMGNGTATGALADFLMSAMNAHVAGYDQAATIIENKVLAWLAELIGFPATSTGLLVSGGTMANINALLVARNETAGFDIRKQGLRGTDYARQVVYGSSETHSWIFKACEIMGMGRDAFRMVPVNDAFEIDVEKCRQMITQDLADGMRPACIVGNAGTVNTAAIDDLKSLRKLADEFQTWLHVDGAFGSMAAWSSTFKHLVAAQAEADSIAFDLHKWGYMPYEVACVLVRQADCQSEAFGQAAPYLTSATRGIAVDATRFADRGIQLSRSFRALKVWMSLKNQGVHRIGRIIEQNIRQAQLLGRIVDDQARLERLAPVSLNTVCFRFHDSSLSEPQLDALNQEILIRIQESGFAVPSKTMLLGKTAIRVCVTNHRSCDDDFQRLADVVVRHGNDILQAQGSGSTSLSN